MSLEGSRGAACAVHPAIPATTICSRCGNYMCDGCRGLGNQDVCDACEAVVGAFPLSRDGFDVSSALSYAWSRYQAEWVLPTMLSLVFLGVNFATSFATNVAVAPFAGTDSVVTVMVISFAVQLVSTVLQGFLLAGLLRVAVVALQGQSPTTEHVAQGLRHSGKLIAMQVGYLALANAFAIPFGMLLESGGLSPTDPTVLFAIVGSMLLLLPLGVYVSLGVQNLGVETMIDPDVDFMEALRRSWTVADGARGDIFIAGLVGGLVLLAGALACCVGVVPASGVTMYLTTATYLALRSGMVPAPSRRFES